MASGPENWFGAKRFVKNVVGFPPLNHLLVRAVRPLPVTETIARLPVSVPEVRGIVRDTEYVLVNPERCSIAKELFWTRGVRVKPSEQTALELFTDLAATADVVLDIGANTGVFSLVAALVNRQAVVHAYEIVPEVHELLVRNVVRNDVAARVECHLAGIGEQGFTMRVSSTAKLSSLPTSIASTTKLETGEAGTEVGFRSLDSVGDMLPSGSAVLIKIDVEATEGILFESGWKALARLRPRILCEILPRVPGTVELGAELRRNGYHLYKLRDAAIEEQDVLEGDPSFHDWLFAHDPPAELRKVTPITVED